MKNKTITLSAILALTSLMAFSAQAQMGPPQQPSEEYGKQLFNDPSLAGSTNSKSCATCHPDGKNLENAGGKENLTNRIRQCITGPLKGNQLEANSVEVQSLEMYIKSL